MRIKYTGVWGRCIVNIDRIILNTLEEEDDIQRAILIVENELFNIWLNKNKERITDETYDYLYLLYSERHNREACELVYEYLKKYNITIKSDSDFFVIRELKEKYNIYSEKFIINPPLNPLFIPTDGIVKYTNDYYFIYLYLLEKNKNNMEMLR